MSSTGRTPLHRLDIYRPIHRPKPWPVVFYVHGGAFHLLSKDTHWLMGLVFARFGLSRRQHQLPARAEAPVPRGDRGHLSRLHVDGLAPRAARRRSGSRRGRRRVRRRQPDHRARRWPRCWRRPEPWAREVFECGVRAACGPAVLRDAPGVRGRAVFEAAQDAVVGRRHDPRRRRVLPPWPSARADRRDRARGSAASRSRMPRSASSRSSARCRRSSRRSGRGIRCSTTRAASKRRSPRSTCRAKRDTTRAVSMRSTLWSGIRPRAAAGAMPSRSSIATCAEPALDRVIA